MDRRTRAKHIENLELALHIFKGNRAMAKGSSVTAILENAAVAWAMLNHEANREDAFRLAYYAGKKDALEEMAHMQDVSARIHNFPNIERGLPATERAMEA